MPTYNIDQYDIKMDQFSFSKLSKREQNRLLMDKSCLVALGEYFSELRSRCRELGCHDLFDDAFCRATDYDEGLYGHGSELERQVARAVCMYLGFQDDRLVAILDLVADVENYTKDKMK